MTNPKVTVIIPSTNDRHEMNSRILGIYDTQDYPNKQLLFSTASGSIGAKRNELCREAKGEIIVHMDSDDLYAPDWISRSVDALISSGAALVGLSSALFHDVVRDRLYLYQNAPNSQLFICGATFCYWRKTWERRNFADVTEGEDATFQTNCGKYQAHDYLNGFIATIHGANTCSHKAIPHFRQVSNKREMLENFAARQKSTLSQYPPRPPTLP